MTLIDFSYLINLFLDGFDELAELAVDHLGLGSFENVKTCSISLYNTLPSDLQNSLRLVENPQTSKNMRLYKAVSSLITLKSYS